MEQDSSLRNAMVAYYIYDVTDSHLIAEKNMYISMPPASTMKLFTTATALEVLGPARSFATRVQYTGHVDAGARSLKGDIYIRGGGDPMLGAGFSSGFLYHWAEKVKALGIDSVQGRIIADATAFSPNVIPPTWSWGEINAEYCAAASGLSIYENLYRIRVHIGANGMYSISPAQIRPSMPWMKFMIYSTAGGGYKPYIRNNPYRGEVKTVVGAAHSGVRDIVGVNPDPPYLAAKELERVLRERGVGISDSATTVIRLREAGKGNTVAPTTNRKTIATTYSKPVSYIAYRTNQESNNLYAETLLKQLGLATAGYGDTYAGTGAVYAHWRKRGLDLQGMYMYDGSGLSRTNSIAAWHLAQLLLEMRRSDNYATFYNSLPLAGQTGTLSKMFENTPAINKIRAKSGTMSRVKSYAGYAETLNGHEIVFVLMVNNFNCKVKEMTRLFEQVMTKMVEYGYDFDDYGQTGQTGRNWFPYRFAAPGSETDSLLELVTDTNRWE
jgi:D-alanyl-D-alanine carboxypeptidase/D-alanyl-D-alanine-endopeptidase (penicillin-binding protein 4)